MYMIIQYSLVTALAAAFILLLLGKWRVIEWLQVHGNRFLSAMAGCTFCLSWWCGVAVAVSIAAFTGDLRALCAPFLSTPLTRMLS